MTDDEFKIFRNLIHSECGICLSESKKDFLRNRIEKRLKALDMGSYFQYYRYITAKNKDELCVFLDTVTINETCFFRNAPQFELLRGKVLPELVERKRNLRDYALVIWSAGCATGEEPYSLAMEVCEAIPDASLWNIRIIASDISLRCLEAASRGRYSAERVKDVPEKYIARYFKQDGEYYEVRESLKKLVVFDYHNLKHESGLTAVDVIFCRNVMIYFDMDEQKLLVDKFRRAINPHGYLFIGHAETLQGISNGDFKFLYWNKGTAYQKAA